mmetsp:Transcript_44594/g.69760  ORF Transcript_44594/g.69760 Transcript_44594/m.69760 type:complete len:157 (+) Transcript_44594:515-985(+)
MLVLPSSLIVARLKTGALRDGGNGSSGTSSPAIRSPAEPTLCCLLGAIFGSPALLSFCPGLAALDSTKPDTGSANEALSGSRLRNTTATQSSASPRPCMLESKLSPFDEMQAWRDALLAVIQILGELALGRCKESQEYSLTACQRSTARKAAGSTE